MAIMFKHYNRHVNDKFDMMLENYKQRNDIAQQYPAFDKALENLKTIYYTVSGDYYQEIINEKTKS